MTVKEMTSQQIRRRIRARQKEMPKEWPFLFWPSDPHLKYMVRYIAALETQIGGQEARIMLLEAAIKELRLEERNG